jgi:hypothetical protein
VRNTRGELAHDLAAGIVSPEVRFHDPERCPRLGQRRCRAVPRQHKRLPALRPAATARECRRRRLSGTLSEPFRQACDHFLAERSAAFLPAFALAAEVRSCAEDLTSPTSVVSLFVALPFETVVYGRNCSELGFHRSTPFLSAYLGIDPQPCCQRQPRCSRKWITNEHCRAGGHRRQGRRCHGSAGRWRRCEALSFRTRKLAMATLQISRHFGSQRPKWGI